MFNRSFLILILFFFHAPSFSHGLDFVKVDLAIDNSEMGFSEYRFEVTTSLVYMSELILGYKDADVDVLPILAEKKVSDLQAFSDNVLDLFEETEVLVDGNPIKTGRFFGISGYTLANELASVNGTTDRFITLRSSGILSARGDTIAVNFPDKLGDVELHIVRPLRPNLIAGETSPEFLIRDLSASEALFYYKVSMVAQSVSKALKEPSIIFLVLLACYIALGAHTRLMPAIVSFAFIFAFGLVEFGFLLLLQYPVWKMSLLIALPVIYSLFTNASETQKTMICTLLFVCISLFSLMVSFEYGKENHSTLIATACWFTLMLFSCVITYIGHALIKKRHSMQSELISHQHGEVG